MTSWQTRAVCLYLRATRKKRYRTVQAGLQSMAHGIPAAPLPDELAARSTTAALGDGDVVTVRPAGAAASGAGALVYLHGGAFVNGIQPQHWSLIAHLADTTGREVHVARYPLAPGHDVGDALAFLEALHERLAGQAPLHVLGDSAGGNLALVLAQAHPHDGTLAGLTLIAPWVDVGMAQPRHRRRRAARPLAHPGRHAPDRVALGGRARAHRPGGEPVVRRPRRAAAHPGARRHARHLPARLRAAA